MTTRIAGNAGGWGNHAAWVHLHRDRQQLTTDVMGGADAERIAADKAAVVESRRQVARSQGAHLVDVTV